MSHEPIVSALRFPALRTDRQDLAEARSRASGHAAGYAAGLRAAEAQVSARIAGLEAEHRAALLHAEARLERALEVLARAADAVSRAAIPVVAEAQDLLAVGAVELAEAIVGVQLSDGAASASAALRRALSTVERPEVAAVRLNPADLEALDARTIAAAGVPIVADARVGRGDAVAELPVGYLDATIATAKARAMAAVMGAGS